MADYYKTSVNNCDGSNMRAALDQATAEGRAVITVVECENVNTGATVSAANSWENNSYTYATEYAYEQPTVDVVVKREYFVRETVQQYKPVVVYVPAGTYSRVRKTCRHNCGL